MTDRNPWREPTGTGRYAFKNDWDRVCTCGHRLGAHGEGGFTCLVGTNIPGDPNKRGVFCDCEKFHPHRKKVRRTEDEEIALYAEQERDEARAWAKAELTRAALAGAVAQEKQVAAERERDDARAALAKAREAALEEAAKVLDQMAKEETHPAWVDRFLESAHALRLRALKTTPTQESETP